MLVAAAGAVTEVAGAVAAGVAGATAAGVVAVGGVVGATTGVSAAKAKLS